MEHSFFTEIKNYPELSVCIQNITDLPEPQIPNETVKAILLGADPTNDGIPGNKGLKQLKKVFGIDSEYEKYFFRLQERNLNAVGLDKDNVFVQNVCRNYFTDQTAKNKSWKSVAVIWQPHLKRELNKFDESLPVLVTAEVIMKFLIKQVEPASVIYNNKDFEGYFSDILERGNIFPLYRHPVYSLANDKWNYKKALLKKFSN